MTWKQIETAREVRLWIGQIIVPAATVAAAILTIPEFKQAAIDLGNHVVKRIENKKREKERP